MRFIVFCPRKKRSGHVEKQKIIELIKKKNRPSFFNPFSIQPYLCGRLETMLGNKRGKHPLVTFTFHLLCHLLLWIQTGEASVKCGICLIKRGRWAGGRHGCEVDANRSQFIPHSRDNINFPKKLIMSAFRKKKKQRLSGLWTLFH